MVNQINVSELLSLVNNKEIYITEKTIEDKNLITINYRVISDIFHNELAWECRGIVIDKDTNEILARPFHKFFNIHEQYKPKVDYNNLDNITLKLDGSMIMAFKVNEKIYFKTKAFDSDTLNCFYKYYSRNIELLNFCSNWINDGYTPIFEYYDFDNRIVVNYKEKFLILTALRNIKTGKYFNIHDNIVRYNKATRINLHKIKDEEHVLNMKNIEGVVYSFSDGNKVKQKTRWYLERHRFYNFNDKNIWDSLIEERSDDYIELFKYMGIYNRFKELNNKFNKLYLDKVTEINEIYDNIKNIENRKDYAADVIRNYNKYSAILFKIRDGYDVNNLIKKTITYEI